MIVTASVVLSLSSEVAVLRLPEVGKTSFPHLTLCCLLKINGSDVHLVLGPNVFCFAELAQSVRKTSDQLEKVGVVRVDRNGECEEAARWIDMGRFLTRFV